MLNLATPELLVPSVDLQVSTTTTTIEVNDLEQGTENLNHVGGDIATGVFAIAGVVFVANAIYARIRAKAR